jgi:uncharacterized protein (DUF58 family)
VTVATRAGRPRPTSTGFGLAAWLERAHLTVSGLLLLVLVVTGWGVARWLGSKTMYLLVYTALLVMLAAWLVARRRLALDVARSEIPTRMREGQTAEVTLLVVARRRATTLIVEERLDPSLGRPVRIPIAAIGTGEQIERTYSFSPTRRGVYELGPTTATWSDPFGLTTQQQELGGTTQLIVHPSTELVHDRVLTRMWEDPPTRPPVSKPWPTGFEFYGMRDYVPGDDLRRVVWSAVAKTGRMLVRESEQGITDRVTIVLDTDRQWHKPGYPSDTFELGVRVVASVGARHIKDGFAVNLATNEARVGTAMRGPRARITFLDELARVDLGRAPLRQVGPTLLADARRGSHFVIVTPHLDKDTSSQLRLVLERGASVVIAKLVWEESDPQSLARAAGLGCQVLQVPLEGSIEAAFSHYAGARRVP